MKSHPLLWLAGLIAVTVSPSLFSSPSSVSDTLNVLAIRVEFARDDLATTTGDGTFDLRVETDPFAIDPAPHDRRYFQDHLKFANNYFSKVSRGQLVIQGEVFPRENDAAYQLPVQMSEYNPNTTDEEVNAGIARLLRDAIELADEDPDIEFAKYNSVIVFHAGVGRDINIGFDETPQDIPSLFVSTGFLESTLGISEISVDGGAHAVSNGIILPETESQEGIQLGLNGILVANLGSQLGFLDMFSPETGGSGIGRFGLMDSGLFNGDGIIPAFPTAWTRIDAGWETPFTIYQAQQDEFEVHHVLGDSGPSVYKIPINDNEYFLVENRYAGGISIDSIQVVISEDRSTFATMKEVLINHLPGVATFSDSTGVLLDIDNFDRGVPGGGILIWHIDEQVIAANRDANRINADPSHRGVDLEEADGSQDIGNEFEIISGGAGSEIGYPLDAWYAENNAPLFAEETPIGEFSLRSTPSSRSYYNRANSHITLNNFSSRDSVMTFQAHTNFFQPNFPVSIDADHYGRLTSLKTATTISSRSDLILTTDQNKILSISESGTSRWNNDAFEIAQLPDSETLLTPPASYTDVDGRAVIVATTLEGSVQAFVFDTPSQSVDTLFSFVIADQLVTYPVVEPAVTFGNPPVIYWGGTSGNIYLYVHNAGMTQPDVIYTLPTAVQHIHFRDIDNMLAVDATGVVYLNGEEVLSTGTDIGRPFGPDGLEMAFGSDGSFWQLITNQYHEAAEGVFSFVSNPVSHSVDGQVVHAVTGNNELLVFNRNLTLRSNFPTNLYQQETATELQISPLIADLPNADGQAVPGFLAADPAGMIAAFDDEAKLLPDFPLAVGDSIAGSPAFLDIDSDGDLELAVAGRGGNVLVWDIPVETNIYWGEQFHDSHNSNRQESGINTTNDDPLADLLPEERVYNWPNPASDGYTFIRYFLSEEAAVDVRIFDLAGDLVKTFEGPGFASTDNEIRWDLGDVQSGVYFARVEATGSSRTDVRMIRIAVVK